MLAVGTPLIALDEFVQTGHIVRIPAQTRRHYSEDKDAEFREEQKLLATQLEKEGHQVIRADDKKWKSLAILLASRLSEEEEKKYLEEKERQQGDDVKKYNFEEEGGMFTWDGFKKFITFSETEKEKEERIARQKEYVARMQGKVFYAPELANRVGMSLLDVRVASLDQYFPSWATVLLTVIAAGINGWMWGKTRCASVWRNRFRPQYAVLEQMRARGAGEYKAAYQQSIMNSCKYLHSFIVNVLRVITIIFL